MAGLCLLLKAFKLRTKSFALRVVFLQIVDHELNRLLRTLLRDGGKGLEHDRHDGLVEVVAEGRVLDCGLLALVVGCRRGHNL